MMGKKRTVVFFGLMLLLHLGCAPLSPNRVVVTREVIVTRILVITQESKSVAEEAYERLPPLVGTPSRKLNNSRWELAQLVFDGVDSPAFVNGQWIQFEEKTWHGFNGCNQIAGGYKINEEGDFLANPSYSTLLLCFPPGAEDRDEQSVGDHEFVAALERAVEYQIRDEQLWLFSSEEGRYSLRFIASKFIEE